MDNLSSKVLSRIKKEHIKPIPRWHFLLKDTVSYTMLVLSLIVGGLGSAVSFYLIENNDLVDISLSGLTVFQIAVMSIPVLWIVVALVFIFLSYYNLKHTPDGFRWNVPLIMISSFVLSILIGLGLHFSGVSEKLNSVFNDNIPYYTQVTDPRYSVWMRPEAGYLAGTIVSVTDNTLELTDLNGASWNIGISGATIPKSVDLTEGEKVKISGSVESEGSFDAGSIRPWTGRGQNSSGHMQENSNGRRSN